MARHIAKRHFGIDPERPAVRTGELIPYLLGEVTDGPELWHQKAYLARVLVAEPARGVLNDGILPLTHFLDSTGPDAVAATVEENAGGDLYPALYLRRGGRVTEHLLPPNPLHDFRTAENERMLAEIVRPFLS